MSIYLHIVQLCKVGLKEARAFDKNYPMRQGSETPEKLALPPSAFTGTSKNLTAGRHGDGHKTRTNESLQGGMEGTQISPPARAPTGGLSEGPIPACLGQILFSDDPKPESPLICKPGDPLVLSSRSGG